MRITTPYGTLMVDEQTRIPLTITNPMFSNEGSHSLPFTVPWCEHNLKALNHPELLSKANRNKVLLDCYIETPIINEKGSISIVDIKANSSIELAFFTREGMFYKWANETLLPEIDFPEGMFLDQYGNVSMYNIANAANSPYPDSMFAMFPVIIGDNGGYEFLGFSKPAAAYQQNYTKPYEFKRIINNWEYSPNDGEGNFVRWERPVQSITANKDFAPFLYVNTLIDLIFATIGLRLSRNDLTTIDELNRLCVLNQAVYAINNNRLNWELLVPNISVMSFLDSILNKFNLTLFVDTSNRTAEIIFTDDLISNAEKKTVNALATVSTIVKNKVSITHATLNDEFVNESEKTLEDIENLDLTLSTINGSFDSEYNEISSLTNDSNTPNRVHFYPCSQFLFGLMLKQNSNTEEAYDYEVRRFKIGCLSHQLEQKGSNVVTFNSEACYAGIANTLVPAYVWRKGEFPSSDHIYWNNGYLFAQIFPLSSSSKETESFFNNFENIKPKDFPLVLSIYRGKLKGLFEVASPPADYPINDNNRQPYASPFPYDREGALLSVSTEPDVYPDTLSLQLLGDNGLIERFFKQTKAFYENASLPVTLTHYKDTDFKNHDFRKLLLVEGNGMFVSSIKIDISLKGVSITDVECLTSKHLLDEA